MNEQGNAFAVVVVARDISERMAIENGLRRTNKKLKKQNQQKKLLLTDICNRLMLPAEELKNILAISQSGFVLSDSVRLQENLTLAETQLEQINTIISNFTKTTKTSTIPINKVSQLQS